MSYIITNSTGAIIAFTDNQLRYSKLINELQLHCFQVENTYQELCAELGMHKNLHKVYIMHNHLDFCFVNETEIQVNDIVYTICADSKIVKMTAIEHDDINILHNKLANLQQQYDDALANAYMVINGETVNILAMHSVSRLVFCRKHKNVNRNNLSKRIKYHKHLLKTEYMAYADNIASYSDSTKFKFSLKIDNRLICDN